MSYKGYKQTKEAKEKLRKYRIGKKHTEGTKEKISIANSGPKNHSWKGGISRKRSLRYREKMAGRKKPDQCEICGSIGNMCFDHDHGSGKFRGWICKRCNTVLGFVKDNSELLSALIKYLK